MVVNVDGLVRGHLPSSFRISVPCSSSRGTAPIGVVTPPMLNGGMTVRTGAPGGGTSAHRDRSSSCGYTRRSATVLRDPNGTSAAASRASAAAPRDRAKSGVDDRDSRRHLILLLCVVSTAKVVKSWARSYPLPRVLTRVVVCQKSRRSFTAGPPRRPMASVTSQASRPAEPSPPGSPRLPPRS